MTPTISHKIDMALLRAADLRERADADTDPLRKSELHDLALKWIAVAESYTLVKADGRFLQSVHARRPAKQQSEQLGTHILPPSEHVECGVNGASLAVLLDVLVRTTIEYSDGKARAAFYLADASGIELHHVVGMPHAYAQCVNGFAISKQSLACGLAVATAQPVVTPDVAEEPRWRPWLWLAEDFGYRACWSFPVAISAGKVLGSFAMYYEKPREATPRDLEFALVLSRTAATIISRH